jgi:hypothetical protein
VTPDGAVRAATRDDVPLLPAIEVRAGERFREVGLASIAEDDPPSEAELLAHVHDSTAWA